MRVPDEWKAERKKGRKKRWVGEEEREKKPRERGRERKIEMRSG